MANLKARFLAVTGVATVAIVVAVAIADANSASRAHSSSAAPSQPSTPSAPAGHYGVLRSPASGSDALPPLRPGGPNRFAPAGAVIRRLPTLDATDTRWVTLSGGEICLVHLNTAGAHPTEGSACNSLSSLEAKHELLVQTSETSDQSSTPPPPGRGNVVSGLVPDGISSVVVRFTDGTQQTVPVESNSFVLNLGNDPKYLSTVTATADSGARYTE